jgi:hypothetical protein
MVLKLSPQRLAMAVLVVAPMLFNAVALQPELAYAAPSLNDDAQHLLEVRDAADAWARGEDPLDFWVPQMEMGFPDFVYYQNLPHLVVATLDRLTFGAFSVRTLFDASRYLLLVCFPLTVVWSMRRMGFSEVASAIGAASSSLLSSNFRYGFEYDSYVWLGWGLFTQLWAMPLVFLALATLHRVANRGTGMILAALVSAGLILSHLLFAYMIAISAAVLFIAGITRANALARAARFLFVGALAAVISSYEWLPFVTGSAFVHISPFLERYKYDSFGAPVILTWLVSGDFLDHGRVPILTLLLAVGITTTLWRRRRGPSALALVLFVLWLVLYFGRPTLGALVDLLPGHDGLFLHRFSGMVDVFAIMLIGTGGAWLWERLAAQRSSTRLAVAVVATFIGLAPAFAERWSFYEQNASSMRATTAALESDRDLQSVLAVLKRQAPGRVYAGTLQNWGRAMGFGLRFNSVRMWNLLAEERFDAVAPAYRDVSFNEDLVYLFDDQNLAYYRVFDISYVIAPPSVTLPTQLQVLERTTRYVLYAAPGNGYAEYANVVRTLAPSSGTELFDNEVTWLRSGGPERWSFIAYAYPNGDQSTRTFPECPAPAISFVHTQSSRLDLLASCPTDSAMVLKLTYHPNWHVTVDGVETATFMLSPSYVGFALPKGTHFIAAEYRSTPAKAPLAVLGLVAAISSLLFLWRGRLNAFRSQVTQAVARRWAAAQGGYSGGSVTTTGTPAAPARTGSSGSLSSNSHRQNGREQLG